MLKLLSNSPANIQKNVPSIRCLARRLCSAEAERKTDNYPGVDRRPRFAFTLDEAVHKDLKEEKYKPRNHPGRRRMGAAVMPEHITKAMEYILMDYDVVDLLMEADSMKNKIYERQGPMEQDNLNEKVRSIKAKVLAEERLKTADTNVDDEKKIGLVEKRDKLIGARIKNEIYNHKPFDYNTMEACLSYMFCRSPGDYASLLKIFNQIKQARPDFAPQTMLDFGSGVGSATWAVDKTWPCVCQEVVNIDASPAMNRLHEALLRGGDLAKGKYHRRPNTTFFRQFLAVSGSIKYDLVVASRTMFEMMSRSVRFRNLDILFRSLNPGGVLVVSEMGTVDGCALVQEAREYLTRSGLGGGTVVAPCVHSKACPLEKRTERFRLCTDVTKYENIHCYEVHEDTFAYIAVAKGGNGDAKDGNGDAKGGNGDAKGGNGDAKGCNGCQWPRIVQPINAKRGYTIARVCTAEGELRELGVCKKHHGTITNQVAKNSEIGDLLPFDLLPRSELDETMNHATFLEMEKERKSISNLE